MRLIRIWMVLAMLAIAPLAVAQEGLFGMMEIKAASIAAIPKWTAVLERIRREQPLYLQCFANRNSCPSAGMRKWADGLDEIKPMSREDQLEEIHDLVNEWIYITDSELWGRSDYWETPKEFVENSGDCEDYAITKYMSLKALGWPIGSIRLAVVHDTVRDIPHAVLVVEMNNRYWVLDNLARSPLLDEDVLQYRPYYAVNERNRWVFVKPFR